MDSPVAEYLTLPSITEMEVRSTFHFSAARSIKVSRAAAPTFFNCGAIVGVVLLPNVPMSKGVRSVSPITRFIEAMGACSSSATAWARRSEEHTSELQSHLNLVCRLLLEKKKKK